MPMGAIYVDIDVYEQDVQRDLNLYKICKTQHCFPY